MAQILVCGCFCYSGVLFVGALTITGLYILMFIRATASIMDTRHVLRIAIEVHMRIILYPLLNVERGSVFFWLTRNIDGSSCRYTVNTWALKGLPYPYLGLYV